MYREAVMEEKVVSKIAFLYYAVTLLSPLFPVGVLIVFPRIAHAGWVCLVSILLLALIIWAWVGLWRGMSPGMMKIVGMATGGAGAVLSLVLAICACILFRTMS